MRERFTWCLSILTIAIETLKESNSFVVSGRTENLCEINNVRQGGVVEINFTVPENQPAADLEILFTHDGVKLPGFGTSLSNLRPGSNMRIVYKFPIIMNRVTFDMVSRKTPMVLENLQVYPPPGYGCKPHPRYMGREAASRRGDI